MLDIEDIVSRVNSMSPNQLNAIFKSALTDADIPFRTDGSGRVELQELSPIFFKNSIFDPIETSETTHWRRGGNFQIDDDFDKWATEVEALFEAE